MTLAEVSGSARVVDTANVFFRRVEGMKEAKFQGKPEFSSAKTRVLGPCMTSAEVTGATRVMDTATVFLKKGRGVKTEEGSQVPG